MQLTSEQQSVIQTNENLVINAVAGSGKTTTLVEYAKSRPANSKILYLAFNKTVKTEAQQKFEKAGLGNVKVETAHSLAFGHVVKHSKYKVQQSYSSYECCDLLGINTGDRHTDFIIASHVNKFISFFCNSRADKVQELDYEATITDARAKTFVNNFYSLIEQFTREALAMMDKGSIAITHDFYLKKFQLSNPVLNYDYILFDEGQDASAAMLDVFLKQKALKVIVGDMHQQIYGWRYAVNSLQQVDFPVYHLSNSFRFGEEIAMIANKVLAWKQHLKEPTAAKISGAAKADSLIHTRATLGRTNVSLLLNAIAKWQHGDIKKLHFEGNINSYTFADEGASLYDILNLYSGKADKIKDPVIRGMKDMKELEDYIQKTDDNSLSVMVDVVKEFGMRLPSLINELKTNHVPGKEDADMIFSTVHRCKGMEYDEVTLLNDFITEDKLKSYISKAGAEKISPNDKSRLSEEVNILYVAATRAKTRLVIPPEINPLKNIQVAASPALQARQQYKKIVADDWDLYSRAEHTKAGSSKKANHGKKWTAEDEDFLVEMYNNQTLSIKEMAAQLGRGENGIKIKLANLGLQQEDDFF